ncbi:unnamed protein product [Schistosoma mattheei]|uniref:Transmembrane protein n=1 Tax=Schistosoma mattheei TaxID=31246 RepID=A0AA85BMT9_9TREM|nr:unnamed protein product [Schistosoma mattheei]
MVLLNIVFAQRGYLNCGGSKISNTTQFPKLVLEIYLDQFPAICTLNYIILCSGVVITIALIFLVRSNQLDEKIFPYSKRSNGSVCVTKDGEVTCTESTHQSLSDSFRRFMIFKCSLILLALCSLAIICHRHKRLDQKLMQKVNFQIAAGV